MKVPRYVFVIIAILYVLTLKGLTGNLHPKGIGANAAVVNRPPFETSMERGRYAQIVSLAESGNFNVTEFYEFLKPDVAWYNGDYYSTFPPGVAVLAVPLYLVGKVFGASQVFSFAVSSLFSLGAAYFIYKSCTLLGFSSRAGALGAVTFCLASVAWPYSVSLSAHPVSAFLMAAGFYFFLRLDPLSRNPLKLSMLGLFFGLCFFIDYPNIAIFIPLVVGAIFVKLFSFVKKRGAWEIGMHINENLFKDLAYFFGSFALPILLFVIFNLYHFGKPFAFTNMYTIKALLNSDSPLTNELVLSQGYSHRFTVGQAVKGVFTLLTSFDRGLFIYSPVFLLGFFGLTAVFKKRRLAAVVALIAFLFNLLIYAAYDDAWGGWAFGPRYLIATLPLLAICCAGFFDHFAKESSYMAFFGKALFFVLLFYSSCIGLLGALTSNAVPPS
ncbi:hypothetical protein KAZ57_03725, partial [Patescibacteria group bacterium]|nr:hypothetical protein [Patescibacteria group bacterium]